MDASLPRYGLGISNCRGAAQVVDAVRGAEGLGAEIAFIAEDINCRDSFQLCAASAAATERIRLAVGVANPYTRNPTSLAMAIATLDEISGGRAVLGLGSSSPSLIQQQMGIPTGKSVQVMRECAEIVQRLLSGERVTYQGERFAYLDAHLEVRPVQERVPLVLAAMGPLMLRLAGRLADGVLLNVAASTEYIRWACGEIERGARDAGRNPAEITVAAWLSVYVADDYDTALQRAREWLATMLSIPRQGELLLEKAGLDTAILTGIRRHYSAYPHQGDQAAAARYVPIDVAQRLALIGTRDVVLERVQEYRDAGVQLPVMPLSALQALS